jgi:thiol-disulfide isomerase/thioredoxin
MKYRYMSYFLSIFIICIYVQSIVQEGKSKAENTNQNKKNYIPPIPQESPLIREINNINLLKEFLVSNQKLILEIYSPTCPHCVEFAPKYETLAKIYKDKVKFVKVDGSDPVNYYSLTKVRVFPSVFIYDNSKLYEYRGLLETEHLHEFVENVYFFKCKKIETEQGLVNFVNDNKRNNYVMGIFNQEEENIINFFTHLNEQNRMMVENCYYYIKNKDQMENNNRDLLPSIINLPNLENYIVTYNKSKFSYFTEFNKLISLFSADTKFYNETYKYIVENYHDFLLENLFPLYEKFDDNNRNNFLSRGKDLLIFTFKNEQEKILMLNIIDKYSILRKDSKDFTILLYNLYEEKEATLEDGIEKLRKEKTHRKMKYYSFEKRTGIYITDINFSRIEGIENPKLFDIESLWGFIEEHKKKKLAKNTLIHSASPTPKHSSESKNLYTEQKVNYVSAKIVDKLENVKSKENELNVLQKKEEHKLTRSNSTLSSSDHPITNKNDSIITESKFTHDHLLHTIEPQRSNNLRLAMKMVIYLIVYTSIFLVVYRKYFLTNEHNEIKNN